MVSGIILTLYCCAASAGCDIRQFDHDLPRAVRGEVSNHLANFEYASDVDNADGTLRLWNYVLNKRSDKGIAISWPKAGIGHGFFDPLLQVLTRAIEERFMDERHARMWEVVAQPEEVPEALNRAAKWDADARSFAAL